MYRQWICFSPEDGSGSPAGDSAAPAESQALSNESTSLRSQLASMLDEGERASFSNWAGNYNTDKDFAKAAVNMRTQFDGRVPLPNEKSKPEDVDKFYQRLGKPAEANGYTFDFGKDEKGQPVKLDDAETARFESFKAFAFKHNLTQAQFNEAINYDLAETSRAKTLMEEQLNEAQDGTIAALKKAWGPDYDDNVTYARDSGKIFADDVDEWVNFVNLPLAEGIRVGDHPTFMKTMSKIGRAANEDMRARDLSDPSQIETVKEKIAQIEREAMDRGKLPSDPEYHARLEPLYKKLYPQTHTSGPTSAGFGSR